MNVLQAAPFDASTDVDVLVIGAGLSGIGAGYHLQTRCPKRTYVILEGRDRLGGTWDLFRYPGIRSDSDMYTLGYSFHPWRNAKAIADGASILAYLRETAETFGISQKIRYGCRVERARWSSRDSRWTVEVREVSTGRVLLFRCGFLLSCAGYYDYDSGYEPPFPGIERFRGRVVHPQKWSHDIDYDGQRVLVIGSGATAVTLVPALARRASQVTMLQRSPTYVVSVPERDRLAGWLGAILPARAAHWMTRWKYILITTAFYAFCRRFPERAKKLLVGWARRQLHGKVDVEPHFVPTYQPWDQRLCVAPDGDLFKALREGRATVVTDEIETFTETGVQLRSGARIDADLVVTATGLKLKFLGGVSIEVDGTSVDPAKTMAYKGMMCSDVPNLAVAIGYTNASWTLKCDLTCEYVCRLLNYMDDHGYTRCVARKNDGRVKEEPLIDFSSGYIRRAIDRFPKQGSLAPWRLHQNYAFDLYELRHASVDDGVMQFSGSA